MNNIFKADYKAIFSPKRILMVIFLSLFLLFFWNLILSEAEVFFSPLEMELILVGLLFTTVLYKKYNNNIFLKMGEINSKSKNSIKINLFLISLLQLFVITVIFYALFFPILYLGLLSDTNFAGSGKGINTELLSENKSIVLMLFYYALLESLIIITYAYFMNHYIKNSSIIFGIIIFLIVYNILFGTTTMSGIIRVKTFDDGSFLTKVKELTIFRKIGLVITPWMQVGYFADAVLYSDSGITLPLLSWWNYSYMDSYRFLLWTPFLFMVVFTFTPLLTRRLSKGTRRSEWRILPLSN